MKWKYTISIGGKIITDEGIYPNSLEKGTNFSGDKCIDVIFFLE